MLYFILWTVQGRDGFVHRWVVRAKQGSGKINLATVYRRGNKVSWLWWKYTYVKTQTAHLKLLNFTVRKSYINKANKKKQKKTHKGQR